MPKKPTSNSSSMMRELRVELGARSYPIYIGAGVIQQHELLREAVPGRQVLIISNETVAPLYLNQLEQAFSDREFQSLQLPDGERFKTLDSLNEIFDYLLQQRYSRRCTLVALGGGVIGDICGFASACYQRGVDFVQVPTTLLAQVDSSVGGKTAVNHALGKNMIGAFHQPRAVLIDTALLTSLPEREFSAGLAEVIKYGLIADAEFFDWLEANIAALRALDHDALTQAIFRSCEIKAEVVAQDETEQGVRALLNLGHTFGHAIETAMNYEGILHGEAVAIGMRLAAEMSSKMGALSAQDVDRILALITAAGLPIEPPRVLPLAEIRDAMSVDKKVVDSKLRLILLSRIGSAHICDDFFKPSLEETLALMFK